MQYEQIGWYSLVGIVALAAIMLLTGCISSGKVMRFDPKKAEAKADRWYIESKAINGTPFSCSFVEFDGRGDYLDFKQHQASYQKVRELSTNAPILLVIYCHGWKNNSQSGDVVEFNGFLAKLAGSPLVQEKKLRVHGLYLAWRGNPFKPSVNKEDEEGFYERSMENFGEAIVNSEHHAKVPLIWKLPENLSYWSRKRAAEHEVSGMPMSRTILASAYVAKRAPHGADARVFVMGHSMGALMLERSLGQACMSTLTEKLPWFGQIEDGVDKDANPLPFDLVLFVNSAAPAIYAKEMRDFLSAHRSGLRIAGVGHADAPLFLSLTSEADSATGKVHPIGNLLSRFSPSMQRWYTNLLPRKEGNELPVHQSEFYKKTPGHQPLLVDHWIVEGNASDLPADTSPEAILQANLDRTTKVPDRFFTSSTNSKDEPAVWLVTKESPDPEWTKTYHNTKPIRYTSAYWIIRCGKELIKGHNDYWSTRTMETYAALYRLVEVKRAMKPPGGKATPEQLQEHEEEIKSAE